MSLEQELSGSRLRTDDSRLANVARATFLFALLTPLPTLAVFVVHNLAESAVLNLKF